MYQKYLKRIIDVVLSLCGIIVLSPVLLLIALWIKLDSKGPVFFRQKRVGKGKTHFSILKFRTMYADTPSDVPTHLLKDPQALITKSGHFLRKTSLDELPQMFNILAGQMSIIGPRPALWNQYDLIEERDRWGANDVLPGLTGWAQVNGCRGETKELSQMEDRIRKDIWYVENWSFWLDLRIIYMTVRNAIHGEDNAY